MKKTLKALKISPEVLAQRLEACASHCARSAEEAAERAEWASALLNMVACRNSEGDIILTYLSDKL